MIPFTLLLHLVAFICFVVAAIGIPSRVNLIAAGLAAWVAATFIVGLAR